MEDSITVSLPTDSDGYLSQQCPECSRRFKVRVEEGSGRTLRFCPYCRHEGEGCWWTEEQVKYMEELLTEQIVSPMLNDFARKLNRQSTFLKFDVKTRQSDAPKVPTESELPMPTVTFPCCEESIKHDGRDEALYCIICGEQDTGDNQQATGSEKTS